MSRINIAAVHNRKRILTSRGEALIHIRANQDGKSVYFSTNIAIKPAHWNKAKKEIRNAHPYYITLNKQIRDLQTKIADLSIKIFERKGYVTLDLLTAYNCYVPYE